MSATIHLLERNRGWVCLVCGQKILNGVSTNDRKYYFTRTDRCQVRSSLNDQQQRTARALEKQYGGGVA